MPWGVGGLGKTVAAQEVCASAVSSFTEYVRDRVAFRSIEQRLLEALAAGKR